MTGKVGNPVRITEDTLFSGALHLVQPAKGHRAGTDAVLLSAHVPESARAIADLGAATGIVGLRAAQRNPAACVTLIERDPFLVELASENIRRNTLSDRVAAIGQDVFRLGGAPPLREAFDCVLTNPPFFQAGQIRISPDPGRAGAHVTEGTLDGWVRNAVTILAPKGCFVMIHRADALEEVLDACAGRLGGLALRFVHARAEEPAIRLIVTGTKGSRAPLSVLPPLVLHGPDGRFMPKVAAMHSGQDIVADKPPDGRP